MRPTILLALISAAALMPLRASAQPAPPGPPPPCVDAAGLRFVCGQQGPEDLVVVPGGAWVVTGIFGGSGGINLIRVSDRTTTKAYPAASAKNRLDAKIYKSCSGPPDTSKFTTHGLSLVPGRRNVHRLFVVGHGGREAIEVFELDARPETPVLTWIGCAVAADPIGLNSVRGLADGGFIASNFLPRGGTQAATQRMMGGEKNGELWEWHTASGWRKVPGSEAAGANGLEMSEDGKTLYVAAWGSQSFFRLTRGPASPKRDEIPLGFRVDNIRWARDGAILAAGQGTGETVVVKIDTRTLAVTPILRLPGRPGFNGGTVAVEVGDDYWIGSFAGDRIAVLRAANAAQAAGTACDRECLRGKVTQLFYALVKHDVKGLAVADTLRVTEDAVEKPLAKVGLVNTVTRLRGFRQDFIDERAGVAGADVVVEEAGAPVLLVVRVKVVADKFTEIELVATRGRAEGLIFNIDGLSAPSAGMNYAPRPERLATREDAIKAALKYPEGLAAAKTFAAVNAPFAPDAYRYENGQVMAGPDCKFAPGCQNILTQSLQIFERLGEPQTRVVAVDERMGIVWLRMAWGARERGGDQLTVWESFKVYDGQIHAVEAFMRILPFEKRNGGWQ